MAELKTPIELPLAAGKIVFNMNLGRLRNNSGAFMQGTISFVRDKDKCGKCENIKAIQIFRRLDSNGNADHNFGKGDPRNPLLKTQTSTAAPGAPKAHTIEPNT